jgi:HK97 family phage portal protein
VGIRSWLSSFIAPETKSVTDIPTGFTWSDSRSGYVVTPLSSLEVSTVMACVRAIIEGVSQVPIYAHARDARGIRGPKLESPVLDVLTRRPNEWQTGYEFRETMLLHTVLTGNAYAYISRALDGTILELVPIEPGRVMVERRRDMSLVYRVMFEDGSAPLLAASDVWHIRGPSWDTWRGLDAVKLARQSIGLAVATEAAHSSLHKNGAQVSGLLSMAEKIGPERFTQLGAWLDKHGAGGDREGKPLILDGGAKYQSMTMSGVDAQHIETRKHQVLEICRHFRVIPMMVGASETPTYASAEQMFIAHVVHTLTPWAERVEQSAAKALLGPDADVDFRHDFNDLMRGAAQDRAEYNAKSLGSGGSPAWQTPNEVRAQEGLDPIEGGDELPKPVNQADPVEHDDQDTMTAEDVIKAIAAMPAPNITINPPSVKTGAVYVDMDGNKKRGRITEKRVTEYDKDGRIVAMEEREILEDGGED